MKDMG